ncbi:manganese-dependent ADP-ribose/CDP-alcohol diphosphatase-like isoform X2 [Limulus polyphemus]|uniref:Manganese-dependent ADP-ribose/CDP-alcohol diphosphatase-like isoform X2 n=1 Tax=Limulus polyphemus TaxID=6850 RepID=A0ABM1BTN2_LIMPO|nr:manganese-dependent ADP-ribose/CDP-alcohol diphosphatase-like isoform X2 [Limulus polyphemus]
MNIYNCSSCTTFKMTSQLLVTFGALADVQYADCEDRPAHYNPLLCRYYREALDHVDSAFCEWEREGSVNFVLQLGDIIDGLNRNDASSHIAMKRTLARFEKYANIPTFHTVGNHELYNFSRKELTGFFWESLSHLDVSEHILAPPDVPTCLTSPLYYTFSPVKGIKCISLDCFEVSVIGYEPSHPRYVQAAEILYSHHGHYDFDGWDCDHFLHGRNKRFQAQNGAASEEQLDWLDKELQDSDTNGEKVILFGHVALCPGSVDDSCLLWNYQEVMDVFHRHSSVVLYLCGHAHKSGYAVDSHGVHYLVLAGIIETSPLEQAFMTLSVYEDKIEVIGYGREHSRTLFLRPATVAPVEAEEIELSAEDITSTLSTLSVKVVV